MKKFFILFVAVVLTAISSNVFAQSSGTAPAPGAKHNYYVTPGNGSNTLKWTVTKGNLTTDAGTDAVIADDAAAATDITWATSVSVGDWYYVHIMETDGSSCANEKVLPVQITASPFYLTLEAANATDCYDGVVVVSLADASTPNYDHGNTTIVFTVTPTNLSGNYTGYTFDLADLDVPAGFDATPAFSTNVTDYSSNTVTVDDNALVTITYTVDNTNVYTNASAANAQDYTATAVISNGKASNGVSDNTSGTYTDNTAVSRPNTSGIGTN